MGIKEPFCAAGTKKPLLLSLFQLQKESLNFLERLANQKAISNIFLVFGKSVAIERKRLINEKKEKKENKFSIIS